MPNLLNLLKFIVVFLMVAVAEIFNCTVAQEAYVGTSTGDLAPMTVAVVTGNKTSGKALLAAYGAKLTTSMILSGKRASLILPASNPSFYVSVPNNMPILGWKIAKVKQKKKERELPYMKTGAYSGTRTELDEIPVAATKISEDGYGIKPVSPMEKGEYALIYLDKGIPAFIYDFAIEESLAPFPEVSPDAIQAKFGSAVNKNGESSPSSSTSSSTVTEINSK